MVYLLIQLENEFTSGTLKSPKLESRALIDS